MYCTKCGARVSDTDIYCGKCGTPVTQAASSIPPPASSGASSAYPSAAPVYAQVPLQRTSGLAIASLVLGIIGLSLFAIIFGAIAMNQIGKDPAIGGRGLAIAGLVLGIIGFVFTLIMIIAVVAGVMSSTSMY